jgi:hypothetical protein
MVIVRSQNNVPIRLTTERWAHIIRQHQEMAMQRERILETVNTPDMIQAGDFGELLAVRFYPQTPLTEKYLVVAHRETAVDDGYIVTAYLARRPSVRREVIWRR